jgi:hypothetical protein
MEVVIGGTDGPVQVTLRPSPPFASPAECHPRPQQRSPSTSAIRLANPEPPAREVYPNLGSIKLWSRQCGMRSKRVASPS